jgi:hypothetical protein
VGNHTITAVYGGTSAFQGGSASLTETVAQPTPPPASLPGVAGALTHSYEFYNDFVIAAYQRYLGRAPAASEVNYWVSAMQNGLSDEQVEAGFIGSAEYVGKHGGSGAAWVRGLYQDLLGRTPTQAEVDYWVQTLNSGSNTAAVAYGFAASEERETQRVASDYQKYLGRWAGATELAFWVQSFEHGYSNEDVIAGFVGAAEYYQNHGSSAGQWLNAVYQDLLARPADAVADNYWLPLLK